MQLEKMPAFFEARLAEYDQHMLEEVEGCAEGYRQMAAALPEGIRTLLDLGCGTGLELDEIFRRLPQLAVTGIDLTAGMLQKLREKHLHRALTLIEGDYFKHPFGEATFDAAVSFESLHHFTHAEKTALYTKLCRALRPGGVYLECDYMAPDQAYEDFYFAENARLRAAAGIQEGYYHYDTPCTVENQRRMLLAAGFTQVRQCWQQGNTVLLRAEK